jgi:hypothetical protein
MGAWSPSYGGKTAARLRSGLRRKRSRVRAAAVLAGLCLLLAGRGYRSRAQTTEEEYRIKAAFIFHFAQLVDWPADTAKDADNSFLVCTLGEDPFRGVLEATIGGKSVAERVIRIRHLAGGQDMKSCQVLFVGQAQSKHMAELVADLHDAPVLTVGETAGFLQAGGMIHFLLEENKVRFEINLAAAESARLKIGSRLLLLSQAVVRQSSGK